MGAVSEDEIFMLWAGAAAALFLGIRWFQQLWMPSLAPYRGYWRTMMGVAPLLSFVAVVYVLRTMAASDVREANQYVLLYTLLASVWVFGSARLLTTIGVSFRDDALERRNPAAAILVMSAMGAQAAIYAGANVGDGPGWWVVLITGGLATFAWLMMWLAVEGTCHAAERVTVDRDVPAAIRYGGYMLASGLVCARGAAGDWVSLEETVADFVVVWPALAITGATIAVEFALRRTAAGNNIIAAILVAAIYVATGAYALSTSPPLSHNPVYDLQLDAAP